MPLPPNVNRSSFTAALSAFRSVVGDKWIVDEDAELEAYRDPYPVLEPGTFLPSAAVLPGSVEEVQSIVRIANDHGIPLWTVSTGNNLAYGGSAPRLNGSVVLNLRRMNRIIEVNEKFAYALVEPGVTYFDLYNYLQERGSNLWVDAPDLGWGSIVGNAVERGNGYTPLGDHWMAQCGMEVVLADGDVLRTGMGAMNGNQSWQLFKYGFGPYHDGMFTQSNYGIVTKLGVWLMPDPGGYRPYMITFDREDDLEQIVEALRPLTIRRIVHNVASVRNLLTEAACETQRKHYHSGPGPIPDSVRAKIMADEDIGQWNFYGALYGPDAVMDAHWSVIRDAFAHIPGARFHTPEDRPGKVLEYRAKTMAGVPNLGELTLLDWVDNGAHINFSPVSPSAGEDAVQQYRMVSERCHEFGQDYLGNFIIGAREMHHIVMLVFDRTSADQRNKMRELCKILVTEAAELGYGEYRTHLSLMDQIAGTYNFNENALMRFNEKLKDALDPNGVLSPGKQGIWPRHLRGQNL